MDKKYLGGPVFVWSVISGWISCAILYVLGWKLDERFFEGFQWSNISNWASEFGFLAEITSSIILTLIYAIILFGVPVLINTEILHFVLKRNYSYDIKNWKNNVLLSNTEQKAIKDAGFLIDKASTGMLLGVFTLPIHAFIRSLVGYENIFKFIFGFFYGFLVFIGKVSYYIYDHYIAIILTAICILLIIILINMKSNSKRGD